MSQKFSAMTPAHTAFVASQKVFFVASAAQEGRVNVSPKGMASFATLGENSVAYLDCTGSGSETRAHLLSHPRLTIMFCAFEGDPLILRLYGRGRTFPRGTPEYDALLPNFEREMTGARQIVQLDVDLVQTSCGMAVPNYDYVGERENLVRHWARQGAAGLRKYWGKKNAASIDGLPTHFSPDTMLPPEAAEPIGGAASG